MKKKISIKINRVNLINLFKIIHFKLFKSFAGITIGLIRIRWVATIDYILVSISITIINVTIFNIANQICTTINAAQKKIETVIWSFEYWMIWNIIDIKIND
jgi:hypothetical protein